MLEESASTEGEKEKKGISIPKIEMVVRNRGLKSGMHVPMTERGK